MRSRRAGDKDRRVSPEATGTPSGRNGRLYVVATPIGNLDDLSHRAVTTLQSCALIACEDTRVTRAITTRHGLKAAVVSCHRFNEASRVARILDALRRGEDVALVSDGGTPGLSDPGALLVRAVRDSGFQVIPIPGPSAVTALWSVSGFRSGPFLFVGFLPQRQGARQRALAELAREPRPLLLFESPHRILDLLRAAREELGDREAIVGREMTKLHEEFLHGTLGEVQAALETRRSRGEFAILIAGAPDERSARGSEAPATGADLEAAEEEVLGLIAAGLDRGEALRRVARRHGVPRREIYNQMLRERKARDQEDIPAAADEEE